MLRHREGQEGRQDREQDLDQGLFTHRRKRNMAPADSDAPQAISPTKMAAKSVTARLDLWRRRPR